MAVRVCGGASRESNTGWAPHRPTEPCLCVDARRQGILDCVWAGWMKSISQLPEPSLSAQLAPHSKSEVKQVLSSYMIQGQAPQGTTQSTPSLQLSDTLVMTPRSVCSHYTTEKVTAALLWPQCCPGVPAAMQWSTPISGLSDLSTVSLPLNKDKEPQKSHKKK